MLFLYLWSAAGWNVDTRQNIQIKPMLLHQRKTARQSHCLRESEQQWLTSELELNEWCDVFISITQRLSTSSTARRYSMIYSFATVQWLFGAFEGITYIKCVLLFPPLNCPKTWHGLASSYRTRVQRCPSYQHQKTYAILFLNQESSFQFNLLSLCHILSLISVHSRYFTFTTFTLHNNKCLLLSLQSTTWSHEITPMVYLF